MEQPKRQLKIDLSELEFALDHQDPAYEISHYLDLETGDIIRITVNEKRVLEEIEEIYQDPETGGKSMLEILFESPDLFVPDWQIELIEMAIKVSQDEEGRFIEIPQMESYEGYNEMVDFVETVSNPRLRGRLEDAISGKGAFRRFKDILLEYPQERQRWFDFQNTSMRQRSLAWLDSEGIEPI